ncbi:MAG: short chain dehydrogenase [Myxococcota bacterium]
MRVIVIGATGTIGSEVVEALGGEHEVIRVSRTSGDRQADLTSRASLEALFDEAGKVNAVVCAAGEARFTPLGELTDEDLEASLRSKLMGQVDLVRVARERLADGGSITLTSGVLARQPMEGSAAVSLVNAGIEGFVRVAALESERGVRINVVSPGWVSETMEQMGMDGSKGTPAADVAHVYVRAVEGKMSGEVLEVIGHE